MNTFGMRRPVNSFGLGLLRGYVATAWREIVRFTLYIKQLSAHIVER